jgi:O-antigen/teichoic acid export membrane protein
MPETAFRQDTQLIRSLKNRIGQWADFKVFSLGLIWSIFGTIAVRLTPMITTILISHWFGIEAVGKFAIPYSTLVSASLLAATGVNLMATRNIAAYASRDPGTAGRLAGMAIMLAVTTSIVLSAAIFNFSDEIAQRLFKQPELSAHLMAIAPIIIVSALNNTQIAILSGLQQFKTIARLNVIMGGLMIVLVPLGLYLYDLPGSFAALGGSYFVSCIITYPAMIRALHARGIRLTFRGALSEWPMITQFAIPAIIASLVYEPVNWICTTIVVGNPGGLEQVGLYLIAMQLETLLLFVPQIVIQVIIPMVSTGFAEANRRRVLNVLALSIGVNVAIAMGFVLAMLLFGDWFLLLFKLDPATHGNVYFLVVVNAAVMCLVLPLGQLPATSGWTWTGLLITLGWAALFIGGTWHLQEYGAEGIVQARIIAWLALLVAYVLFALFVLGRMPSDSRKDAPQDDAAEGVTS